MAYLDNSDWQAWWDNAGPAFTDPYYGGQMPGFDDPNSIDYGSTNSDGQIVFSVDGWGTPVDPFADYSGPDWLPQPDSGAVDPFANYSGPDWLPQPDFGGGATDPFADYSGSDWLPPAGGPSIVDKVLGALGLGNVKSTAAQNNQRPPQQQRPPLNPLNPNQPNLAGSNSMLGFVLLALVVFLIYRKG